MNAAKVTGYAKKPKKELIKAIDDCVGKITVDGIEYILKEGESIVMPAKHPHAVFGEERFKMLLVVVF